MSPDVQRLRALDLTGPVAHHAEGPVWSDSWGGLRFVDLEAGDLLTVTDSSVSRMGVGGPIAAFVRPRASGGYVVAVERGLALSDHPHKPPNTFLTLWDDPSIRMNDGTVDPQGRLLAGSMAYDARSGAARVYRIEQDLHSSVVVENVTVSNGIAFSPDGGTCYYTDSMTRRVDRFDVVEGEILHRHPFVTVPAASGLPDGITTSMDGSVWVALWGGSAVHGYGPDGALHTIVELPVRQVSACTFGGEDLSVLFITTSRQGLPPDEDTAAGAVFTVNTGHFGLPVSMFEG